MKIKTNEHFQQLPANYLFAEIAERVKRYSAQHPDQTVIKLGIGDVTQPLAPIVIKALHDAVEEMACAATFRGYPPEAGFDFIREAVQDYYKRRKVRLDFNSVFVSDGAKSDCGNLTDILGDNLVLIPDPVYPVYLDSNIMSGRRIAFIAADETNDYLPLPDQLKNASYIIYLCSPNNPTGAVYDRTGLAKWVDFANATGSLIIFDAAYEAFITDDHPHSIYEIPQAKSCAIEICSLSKTAGFTGTRCSWTIVPNELKVKDISLRSMWERRQGTKFNGVPYIVQRAAQAALSPAGIAQCQEQIQVYRDNAAAICKLLDQKHIAYTGGAASPYIWLTCPNGMKSWDFFDLLLNEKQIVGTPGAGFGSCGEGHFRLTGFGTPAATAEAIARLETLL